MKAFPQGPESKVFTIFFFTIALDLVVFDINFTQLATKKSESERLPPITAHSQSTTIPQSILTA